jgi:peptide/nickel transport system permease protein
MSVVPPGEFLTESRTTDSAIDVVEEPASSTAIVSRSPGRLAWDRFRADRKTVASAVVVLIYIVFAILSQVLVNIGVWDPLGFHQNLLNSETLPKGFFGVSWAHPLGVEPGTGRDILSRVGYGLSFSLFIAACASVLSVAIGVILGIVAGMNRGWVDTLIGRLIDLVLSFPQTLMLLALSGVIVGFLTGTLKVPAGDAAQALYVILVLAVFGWPPVARVVRGQVLSLREREFVDAARLLGAGRARLYFREVLPNLWAPILVQFTLILPAYISAEAALSYLGISVIPPTPTLGNILKTSIQFASGDFLFFLTPALLLVIIVVSFNLLGDGLRDALDPRSNR